MKLSSITNAIAFSLGIGLIWVGCDSSNTNSDLILNGVTQSSGSALVGRVSLSVYDTTGALLFSDTNSNTAFALTAGVQYNFHLDGNNIPSGTPFTLQSTQVDTVTGTTTTTSLSLGDNSFTPSTPGDLLLTLSATGAASNTIAQQSYQVNVTCSHPNFTADSLNAQGISVTAGSGSNLYNFSAASVITSANGTGPYLCAWDVNGDGIQDTAFTDCTSSVSNEYVNYVGSRKIGLIVKDSCNTAQVVSKTVNLDYSIPSKPGNVFIYGQLSNATGTAQGSLAIDGVHYLATNSGGHNIVSPQYSRGSSGKAQFTLYSYLNYGRLSSVNFGMELHIGNISDTLSSDLTSGTVDVSQATLAKLVYSTDQAGDQSPSRSLTSATSTSTPNTTCQLTQPGAQVLFIQGTPCSDGTTGDNNQADVEVWGDYVCTVSDIGGSVVVTGSFDGVAHLSDNCVGGSGGGGGGVTPIHL